MSLIPKVKCSRCDRSYSGLKNKCPYCGASRGRSGKRSHDNADASARWMIKILLLVALVITAISMAFLDLGGDETPGTGTGTDPGDPGISQGTGTNSEENGPENGENGNEPAPPPPPPTPPPVEVTSVGIRWRGNYAAGDMSINVGTRLEIWAETWPTEADVEIEWDTDNPTVVNFRVIPEDHSRIEIEARGRGRANIIATAGDQTASVIVRVR